MDSDFEEIAVKKVYTRSKAYIRENLLVYPHHLDHLEAKCVLTCLEVQQITELVKTEQLNKLLQILPTKGPTAFHCFLESIKEDNQFIHEKLKQYYHEEIRLMEENALENRRTQPQPKGDYKTQVNWLQITPEIAVRLEKPKPTLDPYNSYCDLKDWEESPMVSSQLNRMYSKLAAHLYHGHQREPSDMTPETATLDGLERLTNDLLNKIESCYTILKEEPYAKPLKQHIIQLKIDIESSNKSRQELIQSNTDLKNTVRNNNFRLKELEKEIKTLKDFKKNVEECPRMATGAELNVMEAKYAELQKTSKNTTDKLQQEIEKHKAASEKLHRELDKTRTELDKTRTQLMKLSQESESPQERNSSIPLSNRRKKIKKRQKHK
ncbi:hypothetical protein DPMN_102607 [Dreissena polymorpha]|uniref:CARD domain-containing protein n=1 Tax=Dreissena polymorpha TaxID=45954 RepID=A0A9D4R982_DREPO|nr:hypothetical protein DPMN_102607 [Dreissena polymorpha]